MKMEYFDHGSILFAEQSERPRWISWSMRFCSFDNCSWSAPISWLGQ